MNNQDTSANILEVLETEGLRTDGEAGRFRLELDAAASAAAHGDFSRRMRQNFQDPEFNRSAETFNELLAVLQESYSEISRIVSALADGNLAVRVEKRSCGRFEQIYRNFDLTLATLRKVLGESGSMRFAEVATNFARMTATFMTERSGPDIKIANDESKPLASPARALWDRLFRAF
ncbi:hypothetical protein [Rhizobium esperanzae]|uniref:Methyl-accepting chemotaxis protein n=1 Tax=Rhizobium esperanzae TaxID=1967781 RepID=A0A7W6W793_9HYPH|nr:hypothetical protein [Rhizobium esperanzae]MBB4238452.1 methyl-accepting chemotaxis protein [Rhizobium esperanzae]